MDESKTFILEKGQTHYRKYQELHFLFYAFSLYFSLLSNSTHSVSYISLLMCVLSVILTTKAYTDRTLLYFKGHIFKKMSLKQ